MAIATIIDKLRSGDRTLQHIQPNDFTAECGSPNVDRHFSKCKHWVRIEMINLSGMWLGTYWQQGVPTQFEMTLLQGRNTLTGNILDEDTLGEASVVGEATGRNVRFTKRYLGGIRHTVRYLGMVSEDGNFMQGQWQIAAFDRGHWEARRSDENLSFFREKCKVDRFSLASSSKTGGVSDSLALPNCT